MRQMLDTATIPALLQRERERFVQEHPECVRRHEESSRHWLNGVPMHWMSDWQLPVPLVVRNAVDAMLVDIDGRSYVDFCLGDTGAMFGHAPAAVATALQEQAQRGLTCMLPSDTTARAGELLAARFGLPFWQMTQTATDANRAVLRWARAITGRRKILVFDGCYHGSLEDTLVRLDRGSVVPRAGQIGAVADFASHARVVDFNDIPALASALQSQDVACVLAEPVMTNAGMVEPLASFWSQARELCSRHGTLLAIDETHTLSSGPRGHAHRIGLTPDFLIAGKAIAGGVPCAVYGFTASLADRMQHVLRGDTAHVPGASPEHPHSGIGTTLAANALATAALVACLEHVMTDAAYDHMLGVSSRLTTGLRQLITRRELPWHVTTVGARSELGFTSHPARNGREAIAASNASLERLLHLYLLNRGVLITPFHNMMLASPATTHDHVAQLLGGLEHFCDELS